MIADLTGSIALITGAGQGIGRGIALVMAEQGADIALADLPSGSASSRLRASGDNVFLHSGEPILYYIDLEIPGRGFNWKFERTYSSHASGQKLGPQLQPPLGGT